MRLGFKTNLVTNPSILSDILLSFNLSSLNILPK